jgi:Ala-tRNA(Pro) deacylase
MICKTKLETYLRENEVPYSVQHHPKAFTAQDVAASEHIPGRVLAKVVMVLADAKPVMLVLPAPERLHMPEVKRALSGKDVHLAHEHEFASIFPDCEVGSMPPFGNLYNVPVFVDEMLTREDKIFFQVGTHTDTMSIAYKDYERLVHPTVANFSLELAELG